MKRKRLLVAGVILVFLLVASFLVFTLVSKKSQKSNSATDKDIATYIKDEDTRLQNLAQSVDSLRKLKAIDDKEEGKVGILILNQNNKKPELLDEIVTYLMERNDSYGLEASVYCYQRAGNDEAKKNCKNKATEIAKKAGILKENESFPDTYFNTDSQEQG